MRAKLIFCLPLIFAVLVGCASNGDEAAPLAQDPLMTIYRGASNDSLSPNRADSESTSEAPQTLPKPETNKPGDQTTQGNQTASQEQRDPLMAMYHGAVYDRLIPNKANSESTSEEPQNLPKPEPGDQTTPDNQATRQKQTEAENKAGDSTPIPELEPRHQSLMHEMSLRTQAEPNHQEPEAVVKQESIRGDPLFNAYHRQIKAAPLSDDVAPSANLITASLGTNNNRPLPAGQEDKPQKETEPQATSDNQQEISASLHLQPSPMSPVQEKTTEEKTVNEPILTNPPKQIQQKQVWIEHVDLIEAKGQIIVEIQLSAKASPDIYISDEQGDSPTLVLDFPGVIGKSFPYRISAPPTIATAIHMANYTEKARVVVDLIPEKRYEVQPAWLKGKNKLLVSISLQ